MNINYKLIEKRHVEDVNGDVLLLEHIKSGARLLKIANDDNNKTFCITFKTEPDDESGIPHILEHSVLNGSKKYPVKSPFDQLLKGSLSTFLNAMTGEDKTMFPAASVSDKDYFNLMDVYLDAVFNPLIYSDKRILRQEGWRIEAKNPDEPFRYTGVVYNEMKGYYSDPMSDVMHTINGALFPDNGYGYESGGFPEAIPTLTQEHFEQYHRKHYHPENSYILLYGNADLDRELQLLDEGYLSHFDRQGADYSIPLQKPFAEMKTVKSYYPASDDLDVDGNTYNTLSFVTNHITEPYAASAVSVVLEVLVSRESGAIKQSLMQEGICTLMDNYISHGQQTVVSIMAFDCKKDTIRRFHEIIDRELRKAADEGLDKASVEAVLNRLEFSLRESNDAQEGLKYNSLIIGNWMFGSNPIDILELNKNFAEFKQLIANGFLEKNIRKYLIDNPHSVLASFEPKQGLQIEFEAKMQQRLDEYKASLSKEQIQQIVAQDAELDLFQKTPETPEQLSCIPVLQLSDINPKAVDYPIGKDTIDGVEALRYEYNTNGIAYVRYIFDMKALPLELLPYASLYAEVIGLMPTKNYTFGALDNAINTYTGSCSASNDVYTKTEGTTRHEMAELKFYGRCLMQNLGKMTDLMIEMSSNTILDDTDRLRDLVMRHFSEITMELNYNAYQYARDRMMSQYYKSSYILELINGIEYYQFLKGLCEDFDKRADEIIANFKRVKSLLLRRDNLRCFVYCKQSDYPEFVREARRFIASLDTQKTEYFDWDITLRPRNEAIITTSKVQYVFKSCDMLQDGFVFNGSSNVFGKIISSDYLQTNVRVRGGAYGCWGGISSDGVITMSSYRDPNLLKTIEIYDRIPEYLANFNEDEAAMAKYIIGTISNKDTPIATSQRGRTALQRYRQGYTYEEIQQERDEILATTAQQIRDYASMLSKLRDRGTLCVLGGEDKIMESKNLFNNIIRI